MPSAGPIGSRFAIRGNNLAGATKVTIGGVAATYTVSAASEIVAKLPATGSGKVVVATPEGSSSSGHPSWSRPVHTVTPGSNHPVGTITATASGMDAYRSIDVYFDTAELALASSNSAGVATRHLQRAE